MTEIDVSSESAQLPSEVHVVMEPISMKDSFGVNLDATETTEELMGEETGSSEECQSDEPVIESVVDDENVMCNKELESNEPEIITITEDRNVPGDATCVSCEGEPADHVDEGSGDEGSVNPTRTAHDSDPIEVSADIATPQRETCAQPPKLLSCEKSVKQCMGIDETSTREEEVEEGKKDLAGEDNGEFKENELFESTTAAQVSTERSAALPSTAGIESDLAVEEGGCRDKEKFCDCLRSLKALALPDVLRDLSSEEIFEAHHNLTEITSVVVQALRGRWQSPRCKK